MSSATLPGNEWFGGAVSFAQSAGGVQGISACLECPFAFRPRVSIGSCPQRSQLRGALGVGNGWESEYLNASIFICAAIIAVVFVARVAQYRHSLKEHGKNEEYDQRVRLPSVQTISLRSC